MPFALPPTAAPTGKAGPRVAYLAARMSLIDRRGGRHEVAAMPSRLTRILLALVTAFVFTGQMEAAAEHCARLAHEAASAQASEA